MLMVFPISTEVHDGRVRLAAVWIALACVLTHLLVSSDAAKVSDRIDLALEETRRSLPERVLPTETPDTPEGVMALAKQLQVQSEELEREQRAVIEQIASTSLMHRLGLTPARFSIVSLLTYMFVHSGWIHLFGNLLFFYVCGIAMEKYWGFWRFAGAYVACGVFAALAFLLTTMFASPETRAIPLVGASGAIAGAMGAFLVTHGRTRVTMFYLVAIRPGTFRIPAWAYLGLWFGGQIVSIILEPAEGSGIAYTAHVGGFVLGLVLGVVLKSEDEASVVATPRELNAMERQRARATRTATQTPLERAAANPAPHSVASAGVTAFAEAVTAGSPVQAQAVLSRIMNSMLQSAQAHRAELADTVRVLCTQATALAVNPQELYQWGKALEREGLTQQAMALLDRAAAAAPTQPLRLRCLLAACGVRLQAGVESERARSDARVVQELDGNGLFAQEARRLIEQYTQH